MKFSGIGSLASPLPYTQRRSEGIRDALTSKDQRTKQARGGRDKTLRFRDEEAGKV